MITRGFPHARLRSTPTALALITTLVVCLLGTLHAAETIRVACIGTSITQGQHVGEGNTYPDQLQGMLGAGYEVGNFGVGGTSVLRASDNPYCTTSTFREVFTYQPDVIVIELGTNDSPPFVWDSIGESFAQDYQWLVDTLTTMSSLETIVLCTPPPAFSAFHSIDSARIAGEICPIVRQTAQDNGLVLAEVHNQLLLFPEVFPDGVHPNAEGCQFIAMVVFDALGSAAVARRRPAAFNTPVPQNVRAVIAGRAYLPGGSAAFDLCGRRLDAVRWAGRESVVFEVRGR